MRSSGLLAVLLGLALGCGGEIPEAIHNPLLVMPPEARMVMIIDVAGSRRIQNFTEIEQFIRNRDDDPAYRDRLAFDYQEFVDHWHLDVFRNIDKLVFAVYDTGWLAVLVGQFDSAHLMTVVREEREVEGTTQRGGGEDGGDTYSLLQERVTRAPQRAGAARGELGRPAAGLMPWVAGGSGTTAEFLARGLRDTGHLFESWPSEHIWFISDQLSLITPALDLWDLQRGENLLDDDAFENLYSSRPHSALLWVGLPRSGVVPEGLSTLQFEVDIRDYITPTVVLGFDTSEDTERAYPGVDRALQMAVELVRALPIQLQRDPLNRDPILDWLDHHGLIDIVVRAAENTRAGIIADAQVIEIKVRVPLEDFKTLMAELSGTIPL